MSSARLKRLWAWLVAAAFVAGLLAAAVYQAGWFLEAPASPPTQADVLVVLGGESGDRTLTAVRLYTAGFAPRVLLTGLETSPPEARLAYLHWRTQILIAGGVPLERILYDSESNNSWEEAVNTRRLMQVHGWRRALVVSDPSHMRRLAWAWGKAFNGSGLEFSLVASAPSYWKPEAWWRDEKSAQAVLMEYIKLGYYLMKY